MRQSTTPHLLLIWAVPFVFSFKVNVLRTFFVFAFLSLGLYTLNAQTLNTKSSFIDPSIVDFSVTGLPVLDATTQPGFRKSPPFYEAFTIYGDGNFERQGPFYNSSFLFRYNRYRDMNNIYPVVTHINLRKDDDPPPSGLTLVPPLPSGGKDFVRINGGGSPNSPPEGRDLSGSSLPTSPMLDPTDSNDRIELGMSHYVYDNGNDLYYVKDADVHVFPIAYRPDYNPVTQDSADRALLLFFYNDSDLELEYYNNIHFDNITPVFGPSLGGLTTGTILPNYYGQNFSASSENFVDRMVPGSPWLQNLDVQSGSFLGGAFGSTTFQRCLIYEIPSDELEVLGTFSSTVPGGFNELRLFHFLKATNLKKPPNNDYPFLAMLYHKGEEININLDTTQSIINAYNSALMSSIPNQISYQSNDYNFADAHFLTASGTEPHDPNSLIIEDICNEGDEYLLQFKLEYCNDENATALAKEGAIFLKSRNGLLSDYQLLECIPPTSTGCPDGACGSCTGCLHPKGVAVLMPETTVEQRYCLNFVPDLKFGDCGSIRFTTKINAANIDEVIKDPVLEYCLWFAGTINTPEICGSNEVLEDTLCCVKFKYMPEIIEERNEKDQYTTRQKNDLRNSRKERFINYLSCGPNPTWENRNQKCVQSPTVCWCCNKWWLCWSLIFVAISSILYFVYRFFLKG